jgi:glutathione peroxidase
MKKISLSLILVVLMSFVQTTPPSKFHELSMKSLDGSSTIDFASFKGKKVLIVNTASECGFTPQYEELQKLSEKYKGKLVVLGVPCNQFGGQEPGDASKISNFCKARYGVTFLLTEKAEVKGDNQHTVYQWLTQKKYNKSKDVNVRWNFGKFLIDENGKFIDYYASQVAPMGNEIIAAIEGNK